MSEDFKEFIETPCVMDQIAPHLHSFKDRKVVKIDVDNGPSEIIIQRLHRRGNKLGTYYGKTRNT